MTEPDTTTWGAGARVVLVHGSFATGAEEWAAQQPLAEEGFRLLAPDRRGYGRSQASHEDFQRDAEDIEALLDGGAHVVAHSYGALGAMLAVARRPEVTRSLALLEPPAFAVAGGAGAVQRMTEDLRQVFAAEVSDREWLLRFLDVVGTDPASLPPGTVEEMTPLVAVVRHSRPAWECVPPTAELASCSFPKLVVSGGHSEAFDAVCDALAQQIDAGRAVVAGAGHEIQFTGPSINAVLLDLWRSAT